VAWYCGSKEQQNLLSFREDTMLATTKDILVPARQHGYGVGAFNCINLEYAKVVIDCAVAKNSPIIVAVTPGAAKYSGWAGLAGAILAMAQQAPVPVALHLDHGTNLEQVAAAVAAGFSGVMIDASHLRLSENIALTRAAAALVQPQISLEGELGEIGGQEEGIESAGVLTDPETVAEFVAATGVDVLATSFGSVHQKEKQDAELDLPRLERIAASTDVPLVLHGGSGVPYQTLQAAIARGVAKVNVGTEMQKTYARVLRQTIAENPAQWDVRKLLEPSNQALAAVVSERLEVMGCVGRAS
jgi:fructose-bisphosphate aldolase, class II